MVSAKLFASRVALKAKKHAPEILTITGIAAVVGGTVLACRATLKAERLLERYELEDARIEHVKNLKTEGRVPETEYTEKDEEHDVLINRIQLAKGIARVYALPVCLIGGGIACFVGSNRILNGRNAALVAAYTALDDAFDHYRDRVRDQLGEEKERILYNGLKVEEVTGTDEEGNPTDPKKVLTTVPLDELSQYARPFSAETTNEWQRDPNMNLFFVKQQQNWANQLLKTQGHLFLNEVYDMLGMDRTPAGAVVGWILDKDEIAGPDKVSFGIFDHLKSGDFYKDPPPFIQLDFNVDGVIYDLI